MTIRIEVTIYDDDKPAAKYVGTLTRIKASDAAQVTFGSGPEPATGGVDLTPPLTPLARVAMQTRVYTAPLPHMMQQPNVLDAHRISVEWCRGRSDCAALNASAEALHAVWWRWYMKEVTGTNVLSEVVRIQRQCRLDYADFLMGCFEALGTRGKDGRYTLQRYRAAFRRGQLRPEKFDSHLDVARQRIEMIRRKIS